MSYVSLPSIHIYWAEGLRYLAIHAIRITHKQNYDKLYKVRSLINEIKTNLQALLSEEYNSVDEQIIPLKGRSNLKQYLKNKWVLNCFTHAGASGLTYDFDIHNGKAICTFI